MREISPGIFLETDQRGANYAAIVSDDGTIVIDTPMVPRQALAFRDELSRASGGKPFLYVINTDHHRGHILGNQFFLPTPVIAHDIAWKHMKGYGDNFKQRVIDSFKKEPEVQSQFTDIQIIVPQVTFSHRLDIVHGGRDLRIIRIGGHTAATSVIWLPEESVLFVGDAVWVDQHPYMAQANSKEWLDGLTYIRKLKADRIVPGRGPVCGREATERMSEYIRFMRGACAPTIARRKASRRRSNSCCARWRAGSPLPRPLKSKTESQIKQGIGRIWNEMERAARLQEGLMKAAEHEPEPEEADEALSGVEA